MGNSKMARNYSEMRKSMQGRFIKGDAKQLVKSSDAHGKKSQIVHNKLSKFGNQFQHSTAKQVSQQQGSTNRDLKSMSRDAVDTEFLSNHSTTRLEASKDRMNSESSTMLIPMVDSDQLYNTQLVMRDHLGNDFSSQGEPPIKHVLAS